MVDRTTLELPEAKVSLDTPYFKGDTLALYMEKPLVAVIIGNIPVARAAHNPNIIWVPALAVQTRTQAKQPEQIKTSLKIPILSTGTFHLKKVRKPKLVILL